VRHAAPNTQGWHAPRGNPRSYTGRAQSAELASNVLGGVARRSCHSFHSCMPSVRAVTTCSCAADLFHCRPHDDRPPMDTATLRVWYERLLSKAKQFGIVRSFTDLHGACARNAQTRTKALQACSKALASPKAPAPSNVLVSPLRITQHTLTTFAYMRRSSACMRRSSACMCRSSPYYCVHRSSASNGEHNPQSSICAEYTADLTSARDFPLFDGDFFPDKVMTLSLRTQHAT
jgi:hypothetical protein